MSRRKKAPTIPGNYRDCPKLHHKKHTLVCMYGCPRKKRNVDCRVYRQIPDEELAACAKYQDQENQRKEDEMKLKKGKLPKGDFLVTHKDGSMERFKPHEYRPEDTPEDAQVDTVVPRNTAVQETAHLLVEADAPSTEPEVVEKPKKKKRRPKPLPAKPRNETKNVKKELPKKEPKSKPENKPKTKPVKKPKVKPKKEAKKSKKNLNPVQAAEEGFWTVFDLTKH